MSELRGFLARRDYSGLKRRLAVEPGLLREAWDSLSALERAVTFKLLGPAPALDFFRGLGLAGRYEVLCLLEPGSAAPALEGLAARDRALFVRLTEDVVDEMIREAGEIAVPGRR